MMKPTILFVPLIITVVNAQFSFLLPRNENARIENLENVGIISSMKARIHDSINAIKDFGGWLLSSSNPNFKKHSDGRDVMISDDPYLCYPEDFAGHLPRGETSHMNDSLINDFFKRGRNFFSGSNTIRSFYEALVGVSSCPIGQEFDDPTIGKMPLNASYYCNPRCGRMIPGLTCCSPQSPSVIDPKLLLFRNHEDAICLNWRNSRHGDLLKNESRVVFVAHGYLEKISLAQWITDFVRGYNNLGYAVIVVDWRGGNSLQYWQAAANVRTVGAILGHAIGSWGIADKTLFVGFSLGGQMIAETSKYLDLKFGVKIDECHGLDPAGPFYDGCSEDMLLDRSHCKLVKVIHTSSGDIPVAQILAVRFGSYKKSGHCDYWVNCGHNQGPCVDLDFPGLTKGIVRSTMLSDAEILNWAASRVCSHWRAPFIYASVLNRDRTCPAVNCPGCGRGNHFCTPSNGSGLIGDDYLPPSPLSKCTPDDNINYYVKSSSFYPYCLA